MKKRPLVTVVITCYNYDKYVGEALDSVLEQTYKNLEIIIINDGSTDKSDEVIKKRIEKLPNITYIHHSNKGVVYTRNVGIRTAKGVYIVFLDADDKMPSDYIASNVNFAEKNKLDIVSTDLVQFGNTEDKITLPDFNLEHMKNGNILHISSLIRRSCIGDHEFDEQFSRRSHEDWDFLLGLVLAGAHAAKNPDTFLLYRQHGVSRNNTEETNTDKFEFAEVYRDILHKHSALYHDQLYYLAGIKFSNQLAYIYREKLPSLEQDIEQKASEIIALRAEIGAIKSSKSYRIGLIAARVPKAMRKLLSKS